MPYYQHKQNEALDELERRARRLTGVADTRRGTAFGAYEEFDPNEYLSDDALMALLDRVGTGFRANLAGVRGANRQRGIRGPLSGAIEIDRAVVPYKREVAETAAGWSGQRANLALGRAAGLQRGAEYESEYAGYTYGQMLDLIRSGREQELAEWLARRDERTGRRRTIGAGIGTLLGAGVGASFGAPGVGAMVGGQFGAGVGSL